MYFLEEFKPGVPNVPIQGSGVPYFFRCLRQPNITFFAKPVRYNAKSGKGSCSHQAKNQ